MSVGWNFLGDGACLSSIVYNPSSKDACTSASVLIVFTWLCTMFLMIYLLALTVSAVMHQGRLKRLELWCSYLPVVCHTRYPQQRPIISGSPVPSEASHSRSRTPSGSCSSGYS
ncbi:hypothetical protein BC629DRAFT_1014488 [Irpex lacteus]|nr:hypothetical protein BC629DRAFT_1014488 [Irpex lacteus]